MSRLLKRLPKLGLIENTGRGHVEGEPNTWRLSVRGEEAQRAIDTQAARVHG